MSESFDEVCASYGDCTWIGRGEVKKVIARLQVAHEHEMEHLRKARFHEGYIAGQRSMDADHAAVAIRLRGLRFKDGGSHKRLSAIAHAVYPKHPYGWTQGTCAELRDELIRLMGGVHDEPGSVGASIGAGCADCDCSAREPGRVSEPDSQKLPNLADSDGDDGGEVTITDELRKSLREIAEHMGVPHDRDLTDYSDEAVIDAIYWRIDNYYQINIDELQAQVIECCKQRDKARAEVVNLRDAYYKMQRRLEHDCTELQLKLDTIREMLDE